MPAIEIETLDGTKTTIDISQSAYRMTVFLSRFFPKVDLGTIYHATRVFGGLLLFVAAFPLTLGITIVTLILHVFLRKSPRKNPNAKRILISGGGMTKALQLARSFHAAGHYVVLTEEYGQTPYRFSRAVDRFCQCVDSDLRSEHLQSIVDIVRRERIDLFVPVSHSTTECFDALIKEALIPLNCETFHGTVEQLKMLSDKHLFVNQARSFGLTAPKTFKITDPNEILNFDFSKEKRPYILKSIRYSTIHRDRLTTIPCETREKTVAYIKSLVISEASPWIMQEFISGKEYCTHGTVRNGQVRLYACCESSPWLLNYKHLNNKPLILKWVQDFCAATKYTGQASFDFIESNDDGLPYVLECNPRTHTAIVAFYNHPQVADAYLNDDQLPNGPIQPYSHTPEVYWLYHELWNIVKFKSFDDFQRSIRRFLHGKEAIYSIDDPWPFFFHYSIHMPYALIYRLIYKVYFRKIDCNLGMLL